MSASLLKARWLRAWQGVGTQDPAAPAAGRGRDGGERDDRLRKNGENEEQKRFSLQRRAAPFPQSHPARCAGPVTFVLSGVR